MIEVKICSICGEEKPLDDYYSIEQESKTKGRYTYYFPYCKECNKKKSTKWRKANPEKYIKSIRKDQLKPERQQYRQEYEIRRKERGLIKKWRRKNKDRIKHYQEKRKEKIHNISDKEWTSCKEYFNYKCAYCGISEEKSKLKYDNKLHKEHVCHDGSNEINNCIPSCKGCNSSKRDYEMLKWYTQQDFFDKNRLEKIYKWLNEDYKIYKEERV